MKTATTFSPLTLIALRLACGLRGTNMNAKHATALLIVIGEAVDRARLDGTTEEELVQKLAYDLSFDRVCLARAGMHSEAAERQRWLALFSNSVSIECDSATSNALYESIEQARADHHALPDSIAFERAHELVEDGQ